MRRFAAAIALLLVVGSFAPSGSATAARQTSDSLTIWWPSSLYPAVDTTAQALLDQQRVRYANQAGITINIRVKRPEGIGGIYSTLRNAAVVAPATVPDLIIVRRSDLLTAVQDGLVAPIDVTALRIDDWFSSALTLGTVGGVQYGIPYTLELQHMVYLLKAFDSQPHRLADIFNAKQSYLFPGNGSKGVNATLLGQYLAAGGRMVDDQGEHTLDREPLVRTLSAYQRASDDGLIGADWLDYNDPDSYLALLTNSSVTAGQIDSTSYLGMGTKEEAAFGYAPIPDGSGVVDGWLWALTAQEPQQRERAADLLRYLLDTDRLSMFTGNLGVLPARRSALEAWETDYATFADALLRSNIVPPPDEIDPMLGAALQAAFESVITGKQSASAATDAAIAQLAELQ
ncbi:MAG: extracellular solute-binding protein [Anaerolineae bacterium]